MRSAGLGALLLACLAAPAAAATVPALPPMAHTVHCIDYPAECEVRDSALPYDNGDLRAVQIAVNRAIRPQEDVGPDHWDVWPAAGDCDDYAVTKRHELLARGWPSSALLLAVVITPWGEHHLILIVRTRSGDFALDNLAALPVPRARLRYQFVRMQSPKNPELWTQER